MSETEKKREDIVPNEYEAVLLAAKLARKINAQRQAAKEQLPIEELGTLDQRKVTTIAIEELASGKIKFERIKPVEEEETFDLT